MKDGEWVDIPPNPNSLLFQIGDFMEAFSNGIYKAPLHRVVIPKDEVVRKKPRQSVIFFVTPDDPTMIQPINDQKPILEKYAPYNVKEFVLKRFALMYA